MATRFFHSTPLQMSPWSPGWVYSSPIAGHPGGSSFPVCEIPQGQVHGRSCGAEGGPSQLPPDAGTLSATPTGQGGPICYSLCPQMPGPLHSGRLSGLQGVVSPVVSIGFAGPSAPRGAQAPAVPGAEWRWGGGVCVLQVHRGSSQVSGAGLQG